MVGVNEPTPAQTIFEMKGRWRHLERNKGGTVNLTPEDTDDIWDLYNLISPGDEVESVTVRYTANLIVIHKSIVL